MPKPGGAVRSITCVALNLTITLLQMVRFSNRSTGSILRVANSSDLRMASLGFPAFASPMETHPRPFPTTVNADVLYFFPPVVIFTTFRNFNTRRYSMPRLGGADGTGSGVNGKTPSSEGVKGSRMNCNDFFEGKYTVGSSCAGGVSNDASHNSSGEGKSGLMILSSGVLLRRAWLYWDRAWEEYDAIKGTVPLIS